MKKTAWLSIAFILVSAVYAFAGNGHRRGSGFNEGTLEMSDYPILFEESSSDPAAPLSSEIQLYAKDKAGTTTLYTQDASGTVTELGAPPAETDPIYSLWDKSTGISITESQISDLQSYLTAETDPDFNSWLAGVTPANWDAAYGWGNHADAGYALDSSLSSYAKLDGTNQPFTGNVLINIPTGASTQKVLEVYNGNSLADPVLGTLTSGFFKAPAIGNNDVFLNMVSSTATTTLLSGGVNGDTQRRFRLYTSGQFNWSDGTNALDTNLYRDSANVLKTDDALVVVGDISTTSEVRITATYPTLDLLRTGDSATSRLAQYVADTTYITQNASFNGASWLRDDTTKVARVLDLNGGTYLARWRTGAAGDNPITLTDVYGITPVGNVVMGASLPTTAININTGFFGPSSTGRLLSLYSATESNINLRSGIDTTGGIVGGLYFTRELGQSDAHYQIGGIQARQVGTGILAGGQMWFFTKNNGSGNTVNDARGVINESGNWGLGVTAPLDRLHAVGTTRLVTAAGGTIRTGAYTMGAPVNPSSSLRVDIGAFSIAGWYPILSQNCYFDNASWRTTVTGYSMMQYTDPATGSYTLINTAASYAAGTDLSASSRLKYGFVYDKDGHLAISIGQIRGKVGDAGSPSFSFADTNTGIFNPAADNLAFTTGGTERMRITSTGVGVGITNPSETLHLYRNANSTNALLIQNDSTGTSSRATFRLSAGGVDRFRFTSFGDWGVVTLLAETDNTSGIIFQTKTSGVNTDRVYINNTGQVSIGTTAALHSALLDLADGTLPLLLGANSGARGTRTNNANKISRVASVHYTNAEEPVALFLSNNDSAWNLLDIGGGSSIMNAATGIRFWAGANTTTTTGTQILSIGFAGMTVTDEKNISFSTTTGTKIGTATDQKIGFWNVTPVIQPENTVAIDDLLINTGLWASGATTAKFTKPVEVSDSNAFYFGDSGTDGSWRIVRSSNDLVFERRESGSWVTKNTMTP